ncbi:O-antigen ligase family protein [Defluviimonas sp. WL0024]|uniref:O-antigen ligase family protein n=2 Tax=Albidovulum TaxID=205889 RepID=A0ABT3J7X7_9RHOB|nr:MULTISPECIES: O-antigen ligase family protein [Defluviimonas]MCU9847990.1 O-antigen ligase family protein [Defluviimonas sp. WL0024]MCW3783792.1 O-antigen ligase family protein [Defluviimonas salinarum]
MAVPRLPLLVWVYLLLLITPFTVDLGPLKLSPLRLLLLFTTLPLLVNLFRGSYGKVLPVDVIFVLHVIWMAIALRITSPWTATEATGSTAIEFLGGYAIARAYIRTPGTFIALIRVLLLLVLLSLPLAFVETQTDRSVPIQIVRALGLDAVEDVNRYPRLGLFRAQVFFAHPIHYGLFCASVFALTFVGLRSVIDLGGRLWRSVGVGICVVFSVSSGAVLSVVLQAMLIGWSIVLRRVRGRWLLLGLLFALMYVAVDLASNRSPLRVFMSYATFSAHNAYYRLVIFDWGMFNVWNNPIFGLGFNYWVRPAYMRSGTMDNFWLVIAVRYGIPGFVLIMLGYLDAIFRVGRRRLEPGSALADLRLAWMITFVGLSFTLTTVHIWTSLYSFVFFLMGAGLWIATIPEEAITQGADDVSAKGPPPRTVWAREIEASRARGTPEDPSLRTASTEEAPAPPGQVARQTSRYTRFEPESGPESQTAKPKRPGR